MLPYHTYNTAQITEVTNSPSKRIFISQNILKLGVPNGNRTRVASATEKSSTIEPWAPYY